MRARLGFLLLLVAPTLTGCAANVCLVGGIAYGSLIAGGVTYGVVDVAHQRHVEAKKEFDARWTAAMSAAVTSSDGELAADVRSVSAGPFEQATDDLLVVLADYGSSGIHADGALRSSPTSECGDVAPRVASDPDASPRLIALAKKYGDRCRAEEPRASLDESLPQLRTELATARDRFARRQWLWLMPSLKDLDADLAADLSRAGDGATRAQRDELESIQHTIVELRAGSADGARAVAAYDADARVQALENDLQFVLAQLDLYSSELGHENYLASRYPDDPTGNIASNVGDLVTITSQLQGQIEGDDAELSDRARALGAMP